MNKSYVSIFEKESINSIYINNEILFNVEELLKSFITTTSFDEERLIKKFRKRSSNLKIEKINASSSKTKYYVNTINALRIVIQINTDKANQYKEWLIKCSMERVGEIINPEIIYDRLKTILYKKGIRKNYNFIKTELKSLENKINYVELNQTILNEDINDTSYNNYVKDIKISEIVKLPRSKNSTDFL